MPLLPKSRCSSFVPSLWKPTTLSRSNNGLDFLRRSLPHKDGIPGHYAQNDLMNVLNPVLCSECFVTWASGRRDGDLDT
jgi:hypothetical protein